MYYHPLYPNLAKQIRGQAEVIICLQPLTDGHNTQYTALWHATIQIGLMLVTVTPSKKISKHNEPSK